MIAAMPAGVSPSMRTTSPRTARSPAARSTIAPAVTPRRRQFGAPDAPREPDAAPRSRRRAAPFRRPRKCRRRSRLAASHPSPGSQPRRSPVLAARVGATSEAAGSARAPRARAESECNVEFGRERDQHLAIRQASPRRRVGRSDRRTPPVKSTTCPSFSNAPRAGNTSDACSADSVRNKSLTHDERRFLERRARQRTVRRNGVPD